MIIAYYGRFPIKLVKKLALLARFFVIKLILFIEVCLVKMQCKIFVINLDESVERLENIKLQFAALGLEFERVSAVKGKELSDGKRKQVFDLKSNLSKYYKKLNDGEIGCYLSHILCWEKIQQQQLDYALIIEDDAVISESIIDFMTFANNTHHEWDYIALSHGRKLKKIINPFKINQELVVGQTLKLPSTTTGQFISFSGAEKLLENAYPISRPVDMDIQYWFEKSLRCFVVRPFPVQHGDFGSDINEIVDRRTVEKKRLKRIWLKLHFEIKLLLNRWNLPKVPKFKL
ncbi:glycosyltransferase family 25 protein [Shewanella donghaensis]|uniref:glycosyltransferase family 25 protein n=1 Tax=Shewanella donghaensis TaxID=238836 RepID=UPI001D056EA5|nr:glycosyltransferase family 25 protein [Shewanella donghaensis]